VSNKIIEAKVVGGAETAQRFAMAGTRLRESMKGTIHTLGEELRDSAQGRAPARKGKLRKSFRARDFEKGLVVGTRVSAKKYYARFVEQGIGPVTAAVKTYARRTKSGSVRAGEPGHKKKVAQGIVFVKAHPRKMFSKPRPFLAPAVEGMRQAIMARIEGTIALAMKEGS
jgi:hypothetical protein